MNFYFKNDDTEFFPTPQKVKDDLYVMLNKYKKDCYYILDPCCGDGGLEFDDDRFDYTLYDLIDRSQGKFSVNVADFLKEDYTPAPNGQKFDAVVMNPPFSLTKEFIEHSFLFSDDLFIIAPFKKVLRDFPYDVVDWSVDYRYPMMFGGIRCNLGLLYLHRNKSFSFGLKDNAYRKFCNEKLPNDKTWKKVFKRVSSAPKDKFFIVKRLTLSRVERNLQLIQDMDIYFPGDESAFLALSANANVKKGEHLDRDILEFDTYEEAKAFQKKYDDNDEYVRNYVYKYTAVYPVF